MRAQKKNVLIFLKAVALSDNLQDAGYLNIKRDLKRRTLTSYESLKGSGTAGATRFVFIRKF